MEFVPLQVPTHLYLRTLRFLAAEDDEYHASAELVRENETLRTVVHTQDEEIARLRTLLDQAVTTAGTL